MHSSSTVRISKMILSNDLAQFSTIQAAGFQVQDILQFISSWPRVPSEYKLQVIADAIFSHYKQNPAFAENLSELIKVLKDTNKNTASYRLGKIIGSWLHQQWTSLPCAELPNSEAYRLFPQHALAPPSIQPPDKPFAAINSGFKYLSKTLHRPLEWEGAIDSFSPILDVIPQPKRISVIGFGDGKELIALHEKWPNAKIYGFEQSPDNEYKSQLDLIASKPNITIHYNGYPKSYKHDANPIDFALIRHPNSLGNSHWVNIVFKTMDALSPDGTLLISFYSEHEMRALKAAFLNQSGMRYIWSEKVNPHAFNPSFMSTSGTYSFDFMLVTIRPKRGNQADFLEGLTAGKTRKHEESQIEVKSSLKKFVVVEHEKLSIVTSPGFYEENHQEAEYEEGQCCFKCNKSSTNYYRALTHVGGQSPVLANVQLCAEHIPPTKKSWENMLKEPWSPWRTKEPRVYKFSLVGQGIPKTSSENDLAHDVTNNLKNGRRK